MLCNPKDAEGNNATPKQQEIKNCSRFLRRQIDLVDPKIVVSLGGVALKALSGVERHGLNIGDHVRTVHDWYGRTLIPLYHPGQRALIHRSAANQRADYRFVAEKLERLGKTRRQSGGKTKEDALALCQRILRQCDEVSYFSLHKLMYLAEYLYVKETGERLTRAFYIRQKDGPYCTDIQLGRLRRADPLIKPLERDGKLFLCLVQHGRGQLFEEESSVPSEIARVVDEVLERYRNQSESDLKRAVYLTAPMRTILRREQKESVGLFNAPIDFLSVHG